MGQHVFLSYHSTDIAVARRIGEALKALDLEVWLDKWEIKSGRLWPLAVQDAIRESKSVVLLVGKSGLGPWQRREVLAVLSQPLELDRSVSVVILPGVKKPEVPDLLRSYNWIDCSKIGKPENLELLVSGLADVLAEGILAKKLLRTVPQIGEEFSLDLARSSSRSKTIRVYTLPNPRPGKLLDITWTTFGIGIENLVDQIRNYGHHLNLDACFGINDAGLVMATFLNSSVLGRVKIGYVRCRGAVEGAIIAEESYFPRLRQGPVLLLADFEVKASNVLKHIVDRLRQEYRSPKIYFAVFGAMTSETDLKITNFEKLVSAKNLSKLGLEDIFIACTMHPPGIEPPLGLR